MYFAHLFYDLRPGSKLHCLHLVCPVFNDLLQTETLPGRSFIQVWHYLAMSSGCLHTIVPALDPDHHSAFSSDYWHTIFLVQDVYLPAAVPLRFNLLKQMKKKTAGTLKLEFLTQLKVKNKTDFVNLTLHLVIFYLPWRSKALYINSSIHPCTHRFTYNRDSAAQLWL